MLSGNSRTDKLLLIGDCNARLGRVMGYGSLANMGLGNATPMASFYWLCVRTDNDEHHISRVRMNAIPLGCLLVPDTGI